MRIMDYIWMALATVGQYAGMRKDKERKREVISIVIKNHEEDFNNTIQHYNELMKELILHINSIYKHLPKCMDEIEAAEKLSSSIVSSPQPLRVEIFTINSFLKEYREHQRFASEQARLLLNAKAGIAASLPATDVQTTVFNLALLYGQAITKQAINYLCKHTPRCPLSDSLAQAVVNQIVFNNADKPDSALIEAMLLLAGPFEKAITDSSSSLGFAVRNLKDRQTCINTESIELAMNEVFRHRLFNLDNSLWQGAKQLDLKSSIWVQRMVLLRLKCEGQDYQELSKEQQQRVCDMISTCIALVKSFPIKLPDTGV